MEAPGFFLFISTTITLVTAMAITLYVRYSVRRAVHSRLEEESLRLEKNKIEERLIVAHQLATIGALTGGLTYHLNTTLRGVNELAKIFRTFDLLPNNSLLLTRLKIEEAILKS